MKYRIKWHVDEVISGRDFDRDLKNGDSITIAEGDVVKEGDEALLRAQLTHALEEGFPRHQMGGTWEADRVYHMNFEEV